MYQVKYVCNGCLLPCTLITKINSTAQPEEVTRCPVEEYNDTRVDWRIEEELPMEHEV